MTGLEVVLVSLVGISLIALLATRCWATISNIAIPTVGRTPASSARRSVLPAFIASAVGSFLISMMLIGPIQSALAVAASVLGQVATILALPAQMADQLPSAMVICATRPTAGLPKLNRR